MTVICDVCNAKMPTKKILELHKIKRHGGENQEVKTVIKPEESQDAPKGATDPVFVKPVDLVGEGVPAGMVEIISADGRDLEVSVGSEYWKGKVILVKKDMVDEVRRILEAGGYFIKN